VKSSSIDEDFLGLLLSSQHIYVILSQNRI